MTANMKDSYVITGATIKLITEALRMHMFGSSEDDCYNHDEVIEALDALNAEVDKQNDR